MSEEQHAISKSANSFPSICGVFISTTEAIATIDKGSDAFHKTVTFSGSLPWLEVYFTRGFAEFTEAQKDEDPGPLFNQELKLMLPGEDEAVSEEIINLVNRPVVVRIDYNHGKSKIMGSLENPARFTRDLSAGIKSSGYQLKFTCPATDPAFWLELV